MYLCVLDTQLEPGPQSAHGDSPGKNTGVGCHALLQGIFPNQGSNLGLQHCRQILYHLSHQGSPCDRYMKGLLSSVGPQRPCVSVGFLAATVGGGQDHTSLHARSQRLGNSCSQLALGPGKSHCLAKTGSHQRGSVASPQ